jgi:hypothetical protein
MVIEDSCATQSSCAFRFVASKSWLVVSAARFFRAPSAPV